MSNINISKTKDDLDVATPAPPHIISSAPRPRARMDWTAMLTAGLLALAWVAFAYYLLPPWVFVLTIALPALWFAKRFILTDTVAGVPIRTYRNDVRGSQVVSALDRAAFEDARRALPASISSYNPSNPPAPKALPSGETVDAVSVEVLPNVGPLPPAEWLLRLDSQPHMLFAAKTKGGKSTMARYGMQSRIAAGESFIAIDAHSNGWLDLPSVGGGLRWNEVADAISQITALYRERHEERRRYLDETGEELEHDFFPRLNVIFDEANEARLNLDKRVWEPFLQVMGSGARKVSISLWMICQSALIKNLGGSEVMRRNYTMFALDHETIAELLEGTNKARRELVLARIEGQDFPAAMVDQGQAWLLDRTGIDRARIASARSLMWDGWRAPRHPARVAVAASVRPSATVSASIRPNQAILRTDGRTDGAQYTQDKALLYLRGFVRMGKTRDDARAWFDAQGLNFENKLYTEARKLEGKKT